MLRKLLFLLFFLVFASNASAANYYVDCTSGNNAGTGSITSPWLTLARAVDPASNTLVAGDSVYFKGNCTTSSTNLNKWGPTGTVGNPISLKCWPNVDRASCKITGNIVQQDGFIRSYRTFEGFTLVGAIWWTGTSTTIRQVGMVVKGLDISGGGIDSAEPDSSNWAGIYLADSEDVVIEDNVIHGIQSSTTACLGGTNYCGSGVRFNRARRATVQNNHFYDNAVEGIADKESGEDNIVRRNLFDDNQIYHISMNNQGQGLRPQVYENVFYCSDYQPEGIHVTKNVDDADIYNNTFYACKNVLGVRNDIPSTSTEVSTGWEFYNNIVWTSTYPTSNDVSFWWAYDDQNIPTVLDYNSYYQTRWIENRYCSGSNNPSGSGCNEASYNVDQMNPTAFTNWKAKHTSLDQHSTISAATFASPSTMNFHLMPGSVGKKTGLGGVDMGAYPRGYDGTVIGPRRYFGNEVCGSGVDEDASGTDLACDGSDTDRDGFASTEDCDDTNRNIFPGRHTNVGCADGQYKTCQTNGTYTSCQNLSSYVCDIGSGNTYFISPSGSTSGGCGAYGAPCDWRCFSNSALSCYHAPAPGDCLVMRSGVYNSSWSSGGTTRMFYISNKDGTSSQPIMLTGAPGDGVVSIEGVGVSPTQVVPVSIDDSNFWIVRDIEVHGGYSNAGIFMNGGTDAEVFGTRVYDIDGNSDNNVSGIKLTAAHRSYVHHNESFDNYERAQPTDENNSQIIWFDSDYINTYDNVTYTTSHSPAGGYGIKVKHAGVNGGNAIKRNIIMNMGKAGIASSQPKFTISQNYLEDCNEENLGNSILIADLGGQSDMSEISLEFNTIVNGPFIQFDPTTDYAAISKPSLLARRNIVIDNRPTTYFSDGSDGFVRIRNYGNNTLYDDVVGQEKFRFRENCYHQSAGTALYFSVFGDAGSGNKGATYANYSAWAAAAFTGNTGGINSGELYETNSYNVNPVLNQYGKATATQCAIAGWNNDRYEICGDGIDNDLSGVYGHCKTGEVNAKTGKGCDLLCDGLDKDRDGYFSDGSGPLGSTDCDDTDRDIYPGVATSDDGGTTWKTCQSNGSYTSPSSSDWCPAGCTSCKYIDKTSGSNSNNGNTVATAWQNQLKFATYTSPPGGTHTPVAGQCFVFRNGTYNDTYTYNSNTVGLYWSVDGTNTDHIKLLVYPGHRAYFNSGGTSGTKKNPFQCDGCTYVDIDGLEFQNNYCDSSSIAPDAGCVSITNSSNMTLSRLKVSDSKCPHGNNCSGIALNTASSNVDIHHVMTWDNFDRLISGANNTEIVTFKGDDNTIRDSTFYRSPANYGVGPILKQKHAQQDGQLDLKRNSIYGGTQVVALSGPGYTINNNIIAECQDKAFYMADLGGETHMTGTMGIEYNTLVNCRPLTWNPETEYDTNGATAADRCSGTETIGTMNFRYNVVLDASVYNGDELNFFDFDRYGPDPLYTLSYGAGKFVANSNCYYNVRGNALRFNIYAANNGNTTCAGRGNSGTEYTSYATWLSGSGLDAASYNIDPVLNSYQKATATNCSTFGWNSNLGITAPPVIVRPNILSRRRF